MVVIGVLAGLCLLVAVCGLRIVPVRQALVTVSTLTGAVQRLAVGPGWTLILPGLEKTEAVDLAIDQRSSRKEDVATGDSKAVATEMVLLFGLDAQRLRAINLNGILPRLSMATQIVESRADFLLRALATRFPLQALLDNPDLHTALAGQIQQDLDAQLAVLGVRILEVRLRFSATPFMVEAEMSAQAQARALSALVAAGEWDETQLAQLLPLHLLQNNTGPAHLLTTLQVNPTGPAAGPVNGPATQLHWLVGAGNERNP